MLFWNNNFNKMNIHPIFVHFPIALLTLYSLAELIRWRRITELAYWFYVKAFAMIKLRILAREYEHLMKFSSVNLHNIV